MAIEKRDSTGAGSDNGIKQRTQKAQATRAITQAKLDKLPASNRYAHGKIMACRRALESVADHVVDGGQVTGELLAALAAVESEAGQCMFATR